METSCESPSVPPAPSTLKTSMPSSSLAAREAPWNARAVVSHPPPAAAGAMIDSWRVGNGLDASSPPDAPPGTTIAATAATANAAPISALEPILQKPGTPEVPRNYPCPPCPGPSPLASACLALLLTACGGKDKPKPTATANPEVTAAAKGDTDANQCRRADDPGKQTRDKLVGAGRASSTRKRTYVATVKTNCGTFEITLDAKRAPKTGGSFKYLADQGFYDGLLIHRIVPGFVFQGGDPEGTGAGRPRLHGRRGAAQGPQVRQVRRGDGQDRRGSRRARPGSQFFVVTGDRTPSS